MFLSNKLLFLKPNQLLKRLKLNFMEKLFFFVHDELYNCVCVEFQFSILRFILTRFINTKGRGVYFLSTTKAWTFEVSLDLYFLQTKLIWNMMLVAMRAWHSRVRFDEVGKSEADKFQNRNFFIRHPWRNSKSQILNV